MREDKCLGKKGNYHPFNLPEDCSFLECLLLVLDDLRRDSVHVSDALLGEGLASALL